MSELKNLVRRFEKNTRGRDLIVGDIHGHFVKLTQALCVVDFNPAHDRLFSVGDLVDRGPDCDHLLVWLAQPWFHAVRGNHEDMAIRWPNGNMDPVNYMQNGGGWNIGNPPELQREIAESLQVLPVAIELNTEQGLIGIVHAGCPFPSWTDFIQSLEDESVSKNMRAAIYEAALWSRERITGMDDSIVDGVRAVVVGHTPMERATTLGNTYFIDTMGWRGREFTILDASTLMRAYAPIGA